MRSTWNFAVSKFKAQNPKTMDTPEHVAQCLSCEKPDCTNCFYPAVQRKPTRKPKRPKAQKPVREKSNADPCGGCYSRETCGAIHGTCNEKARWVG